MRDVKRVVLAIAFAGMLAVLPRASFADEKVEGKVVRAELTLCDPRPAGGGCQGTLTLETKADGSTAQQMAITVRADTIIKRDQDFLLLPATQGSSVVVTYVAERGQKVAKSIDVLGVAR